MQTIAVETNHDTAMSSLHKPPSPSSELVPQSEQTRLHILWNECMEHSARPVKHDKTVVLLLSWDKTCDDLQTGKEVRDLATVFREKYQFKVEQRLLNHEKRAQTQVNQHLANFVAEHDDPHALLIIYYAGHGWSEGSGQIRLLGKVTQASIKEKTQLERNSIAWHSAENNIASTDSDVLVIFDCCYAGSLHQPDRSPRGRCFEFLAACTADQTTRKPGPDSFTSALIWALEKLAVKPFFTSSDLQHMITKAPDFPKTQYPQLFDRFDPSPEHISISPSSTKNDCSCETPQYREALDLSKGEYLDLRFYFRRKPDDAVIRQTAHALRRLLREPGSELAAERISFKGRYPVRQIAEAAARHWLDRALGARRESSLLQTPSVLETPGIIDTVFGRVLDPPTPITPTISDPEDTESVRRSKRLLSLVKRFKPSEPSTDKTKSRSPIGKQQQAAKVRRRVSKMSQPRPQQGK